MKVYTGRLTYHTIVCPPRANSVSGHTGNWATVTRAPGRRMVYQTGTTVLDIPVPAGEVQEPDCGRTHLGRIANSTDELKNGGFNAGLQVY